VDGCVGYFDARAGCALESFFEIGTASRMMKKKIRLLINPRTQMAFAYDLFAAAAAWGLAYLFRFNFEIPTGFLSELARTVFWVVPVQTAVFIGFGLYQGIWRYASLPDLKRILSAVVVASMLAPLLILVLRLEVVLPRSVLLLDPILLLLIMGGGRFIYRAWKEHALYGSMRFAGEPVLLLGAGDAAAGLIKELTRSREWHVVGLLDDNLSKHDRFIQGVKILGRLDKVQFFAEELGIQNVIIAMPSASHSVRRRAVEICNNAGLKAMMVPAFEDLISGRLSVAALRRVELDDLLGRDPVVLDDAGLHGLLTDKVVMVTGAGGSIGSELCRQIAGFHPRLLVFYELGEFSLYRMEQEFAERLPDVPIACVIGDVKDAARVEQTMRTYRPSVVFHAAAYKHVPLMEKVNAFQALTNNVLGTLVAAKAAKAAGVGKFVMISTDKAVNPTNVMGASKRLAEIVCQAIQGAEGTRFVSVRFGNVLGSSGSVIPKFQKQIESGGPVTVTHPEITRYFMSISEAAQLVLQAGLMGNGGEIFVMEMGEPVRIVDLARDMIRLSGFTEDEIKISYTGLRPGEKLYEELLADDEQTLPTHHPKLRIAKARQPDEVWLVALLGWLQQDHILSDELVKEGLRQWVPEYCNSPRTNSQPLFPHHPH
jgi:FlaA1/EpsC-like NDP-sugar epimerase